MNEIKVFRVRTLLKAGISTTALPFGVGLADETAESQADLLNYFLEVLNIRKTGGEYDEIDRGFESGLI